MTPQQVDEVVAEALGLAAMPAGDQSYTVSRDDGLEVELHLSANRDYLLILCPVGEYPEDGAQGAHMGALFANLASARSGVPPLAFDSRRAVFLARSVLWLPCLAPAQLAAALEGFAAHCVDMRQRMSEAAQAAI